MSEPRYFISFALRDSSMRASQVAFAKIADVLEANDFEQMAGPSFLAPDDDAVEAILAFQSVFEIHPDVAPYVSEARLVRFTDVFDLMPAVPHITDDDYTGTKEF